MLHTVFRSHSDVLSVPFRRRTLCGIDPQSAIMSFLFRQSFLRLEDNLVRINKPQLFAGDLFDVSV
jgi:hypothetical protein